MNYFVKLKLNFVMRQPLLINFLSDFYLWWYFNTVIRSWNAYNSLKIYLPSNWFKITRNLINNSGDRRKNLWKFKLLILYRNCMYTYIIVSNKTEWDAWLDYLFSVVVIKQPCNKVSYKAEVFQQKFLKKIICNNT